MVGVVVVGVAFLVLDFLGTVSWLTVKLPVSNKALSVLWLVLFFAVA